MPGLLCPCSAPSSRCRAAVDLPFQKRSDNERQPRRGPPRITVRLYHDARAAEVVEFQNERHFKPVYNYPNGEMRQRDEKVQLNRFLSEYLSTCLAHGACADRPVVVTGY